MKLYETLGLEKGCSNDEIKKAYRKMAMTHHPDKGGDPNTFKAVNRAYGVLGDPEKRAKYDMLGDNGYDENSNGGMSAHEMDPTNIFDHLFGRAGGSGFFHGMGGMGGGGAGMGIRRCRNVQHVIQITNKEAYFGGIKHLKATIRKKCLDCMATCSVCQGQGQINELQRMGPFTTMSSRPCEKCEGTGQQAKGKKTCTVCNGKSDYTEEKKLELNIPAGVETGHQIVFKGLGEQPHTRNSIAGDLVFEVLVVLDTVFERAGLNLIHKHELTFLESIIGKDIEVPLYDEPYKLNTSKFGIIEPNKQYKISGKGMKTDSDNKKGDLILVFQIKYPVKELTEEFKKEVRQVFEKHV